MARLLTAPIKVLDKSDMTVITHRVIFARLHGLLILTWCKITQQLSRNYPYLLRYLPIDYFRRKGNITNKKKGCSRVSNSFLFLYVEEHRTRFVDSRESDTIKLIHNAAPERTKKSINLLLTCDTEGLLIKQSSLWYVD